MSLSIALFERQPQSIAVCYLYPLYPSQNTPSCYFSSYALTLKALKGKTAEGRKTIVVSITILQCCFFLKSPLSKGVRGLSLGIPLAVAGFLIFLFFYLLHPITHAVVYAYAYEQLFSFSFHLLAFTKTTGCGRWGRSVALTIEHGVIFYFYFFIFYTYIIPAAVYAFWSLSSSFRRMSCACTNRKILPAITPRNAGGISPRAHEAGGRMCEGRFSVLFPWARPRGNPSHFLSERPERKCAKKESPTPLYRPILTLYQWC